MIIKTKTRISLIICILGIITTCFGTSVSEKSFELTSPNGKLKVLIRVGKNIKYSLIFSDKLLLENNELKLVLKDKVLGEAPIIKSQKMGEFNEVLTPVVPLKFSKITDHYNNLYLEFEKDFGVEFRTYDDGFAYRFITKIPGEIEIIDECFSVNFPDEYKLHLQQTPSFKTNYEYPYTHLGSSKFDEENKMSTLPVLVETKNKYKILISESNLFDYPAMFIRGKNTNGVQSIFPKNPIEFEPNNDRSLKIIKEADYIAKTDGNRNFPWRYFMVSENDGDLLENTLTYQLAPKSKIKDPSWIKPGQVSWEWWNGASAYNVDFVSGYNEETYKYYIDFASEFGISYIIMDEGWAKSTTNPYTPNPDIDLFELIKYGKERNVDIVLWLPWLTVENNFELFKTFKEWGIAGIKIDFMDRSDQWMVNFYERVAKEAAKHKLFIDFHGAFKPAGLERAYPNILTYEGVLGMEQMSRATPDNSIYLPFMRNAVGSMDYTPGAMLSMQPEIYHSKRPNSAGIGTRAYQMALFVIFESGLQMLADSPSNYYRERECTEYITNVPVTWDETLSLDSKLGEYVIIAKRKGEDWYIGAMTNNNESSRLIEVSLDFLYGEDTYEMEYFEDGVNAAKQAMDYRHSKKVVKKTDKLNIKMVRNGGFAGVLKKIH
ncbi:MULTISPECIES: glycoside hydrolase family 97 protein [Zunongwangia]|uniref:Alpha-glucosidase n=1 Tax=Zunongwangia atlantica 22II14-10F7 TaxID=1185767 RepID=A0A1Y1T529_9FLAO|nr:glycoside hydrolase family 97 protein [Zunongwangia atlantica]ORL46151.1 alpha-glucosidase [Zunongwangia atlantica 22II14-10F7]|tara:strand:- start:13512 stop:15491 length:1980 start_codon:yes stop_codon:yes gene_type:complete